MFYTNTLLFDNTGNILHLQDVDGITKLSKYLVPIISEPVYTIDLTGDDTRALINHAGGFCGFCYNSTNNHLYYLKPGDYLIKELDPTDGKEDNSFGIKPLDYQALPEKYKKLDYCETIKEISQMLDSISEIKGMELLDNRYLFVGHHTNKFKSWNWIVHDLLSGENAYVVEDTVLNKSKIFTSKDSLFYLYTPPSFEEIDNSNGTIEIYAFDIIRND